MLVMAPVGMLGTFMVAAVITYVMPKKYESFATIEIKPRLGEGITAAHTEPAFLPTEMETIKSRNSLMRVIDALDLVNRWGLDRDSVLAVLKKIVVTENIRGTDLISIRVRHTNKEDARDITAEVARAYKDYREEIESHGTEAMILELKKAVREQEDKVEERRKVLTTIARIKGPNGGSDPVGVQDYVDAKREFESDMTLLEQLKLKLITGEITQGLPSQTIVVHDDPIIADSPISPNVTLNLVLGLAAGLVISPFLALPMMALMNRRGAHAPSRVDQGASP